jgi:membrane-associated phospholipid phosphatase
LFENQETSSIEPLSKEYKFYARESAKSKIGSSLNEVWFLNQTTKGRYLMHSVPRSIGTIPVAVFILWVVVAPRANGLIHAESPYDCLSQRFHAPAGDQNDLQPGVVCAIEHPTAKTGESRHPFVFRQLWDDIRYLASEPDFYAVVGGLSLTPVVLKSAFRSESTELNEIWISSKTADNFFEFGDGMGHATFPVAASITLLAFGRLGRVWSVESFGSDLLRAQVITGILTRSMKIAINRTRSDGGTYSYPSGHTSTAFTIAGVVYKDLGPIWGIPAFVAASYVGLSRLQENKHYLSDVVAGAVLGSYISFKISCRHRQGASYHIAPIAGSRRHGISFRYEF